MIKKVLIAALTLMTIQSFGQRFPFYENHELEKDPVLDTRVVENEMYHYTKYLMSVEYIWNGNDGRYYKYETEHYKVKLSTNAAIEEFNKVYISAEDVIKLQRIETRVIKEDKVVEIDPKIEEFNSEDESERVFYFPLSGIELGDEIEVLYTVQKESDTEGDQYYFQSDIPIYDFDFYFIAPNDTYFKFLAHNGLKKPELVDTILQKHQWTIHMDSIPALEPEYFSEYNNTSMKLDISLRGFDSPYDNSFSPYEQFNNSLNMVYNSPIRKKDMKALKSLNEELGVHKMRSEEDKIRKIEHFIKVDLLVSSNVPDMFLSDVVKYRKANSISAIQLYMGLCKEANIPYQYGFISDRYDTQLSSEIESMYFLQNYFMYFPDIDQYLAPLDFSTRLGYMNADWIPNNGYFLVEKKYPYRSTNWEIKPVKSTAAHDNIDSIIIRIKVQEDMQESTLTVERHLKGYKAGEYQTYYYLYSDEKRKEYHDELLNFMKDNSTFAMTDIQNINPEDAFVKPLVIKGKLTELNTPFLEIAKDKTIFKLGNLFGEHVSVDELEKKKSDFVFSNPMIRSYTVIVEFPKEVKVANNDDVFVTEDYCELEDINMIAGFKLEGNKLTFSTREEYLSQRYKIEDKIEVFKAFEFYHEISKMNLIIE
ncbi:DUF3857 domain-containing protein [Paracrocinitomix mangrovi]|uniref:DUF3857 domain-containing protein n=1 Tax=Paracrocinitomix mangrovi TaxID=2862509 RepID=UPI001C8E6C8D|nr:DUF3857 domain-containing protein [Paracrocinitomix mangrovi]UKN01929.1 DUF3857 domain-containing protein [Paracrocinitomix mangrovi]